MGSALFCVCMFRVKTMVDVGIGGIVSDISDRLGINW